MRRRWAVDLSDIRGAKETPYGRNTHLDFARPDPYDGVYSVVKTRASVEVGRERMIVADAYGQPVVVTLPDPSTQTLPVWIMCANGRMGVTVRSKAGARVGTEDSITLAQTGTALMLVPCENAWFIAGRS